MVSTWGDFIILSDCHWLGGWAHGTESKMAAIVQTRGLIYVSHFTFLKQIK
jgi:hypothetical protein